MIPSAKMSLKCVEPKEEDRLKGISDRRQLKKGRIRVIRHRGGEFKVVNDKLTKTRMVSFLVRFRAAGGVLLFHEERYGKNIPR